jgi:hypothetical protein
MEIFGKHIFGSCAENWLKLCKDKKRDWILAHTNQKNKALIAEFINNPAISKDCKCSDCGKHKEDATITSGIPKTTTTTPKSIDVTKSSGGNRTKRQAKPKK